MKLAVKQLSLRDVFSDRVRVHHSHRPDIAAGDVCIVKVGGRKIRAVARGHSPTGELLVDLKTRRALDISDWQQKVDVEITSAKWWDYCLWGLQASEAVVRISCWLAVVSIVLGAVGLLLGVLSLWITLENLPGPESSAPRPPGPGIPVEQSGTAVQKTT